jgi:hypothetical protein
MWESWQPGAQYWQVWDDRSATLQTKLKKGISVQYGTVRYSTVRYSTVLSRYEIRLFVLSHSPSLPLHSDSTSLSPVVVTAEDFRRRSNMSDCDAGKNMATSDPVSCSCAELEGPLARERGNALDARNITLAWRQWSKGHCIEKLHFCEADEMRTSPGELPRSVVKSFVT